jgi:hypothetical protein
MAESMRIMVALNRADIRRAETDYQLQVGRGNSHLMLGMLIFNLAFGIMRLVLRGPEIFGLLFVILVIAAMIYGYIIGPAIAVRRFDRDPGSGKGAVWNINADEIILQSGGTETRFDWSQFRDFMEGGQTFLLLKSDSRRSFQIIPKRVFETPEQIDGFRQLLKSKFPAGRKPLSKASSILFIVIMTVLLFSCLVIILGGSK